MKFTKQAIEQVLKEYRDSISHVRHKEADIEEFMAQAAGTLFDYAAQFPQDTEFQYRIAGRYLPGAFMFPASGRYKWISGKRSCFAGT